MFSENCIEHLGDNQRYTFFMGVFGVEIPPSNNEGTFFLGKLNY